MTNDIHKAELKAEKINRELEQLIAFLRAYENQEPQRSRVKELLERANDIRHSMTDAAEGVVEDVASRVASLWQESKQLVIGSGHKVAEGAQNMGQAVSDSAHTVGQKMSDGAQSIADKVKSAGSAVSGQASRTKNKAQQALWTPIFESHEWVEYFKSRGGDLGEEQSWRDYFMNSRFNPSSWQEVADETLEKVAPQTYNYFHQDKPQESAFKKLWHRSSSKMDQAFHGMFGHHVHMPSLSSAADKSGLFIDAQNVHNAPVSVLFGALAMFYLFKLTRRVFQVRREALMPVGDGTAEVADESVHSPTRKKTTVVGREMLARNIHRLQESLHEMYSFGLIYPVPFLLILVLELFGMAWFIALPLHAAMFASLFYYNCVAAEDRMFNQWLPVAQLGIQSVLVAIGSVLAFNALGVLFC